MGAVDELDSLFLLPASVDTILSHNEVSSRLVMAMPKLRDVCTVCLSHANESQREVLAQGLATVVYQTAVIFDRLDVNFFNFALRGSHSICDLAAAVCKTAPAPPALIEESVWLAASESLADAASLSKKRHCWPAPGDRNKRMKWTPDLQEAFADAVAEMGGLKKASPKGILALMAKMGHEDLNYKAAENYLTKSRRQIKKGNASV